MCWTTMNKDYIERLKSPYNMTVYKILQIKKNFWGNMNLYSPFYDLSFKWIPEKIYYQKIQLYRDNNLYFIDEGLHCYRTLSAAIENINLYSTLHSSPLTIVSAIIPRDTDYYLNEQNEIVTEKLKIVL